MNRRGFFGLLAGALSTAAVDPERLLWTPGKKLISIPPPAIVPPGNSLIVPEVLYWEMLRALKENLLFSDICQHPHYPSVVGYRITVKRPPRFTA